jgi:hypothetical protein
MSKEFNPDDFFQILSVKDVIVKFPQLSEIDFTKESLKDKLIEINYEVISKEYVDKQFSSIEDYFEIEVDEIV